LNLKVPDISQAAITGISEVILIILFCIQPFGTTKIASSFAPIVIIWLLFNLSIGLYNIITQDYTVLSAFSPYWIYAWFARNGSDGWVRMGGILLAFTGVEALFADLGHFSRSAVQLSWIFLAYPVSSLALDLMCKYLLNLLKLLNFIIDDSVSLSLTSVRPLTSQMMPLVLPGATHSLRLSLLQ
jgi:KUP system potassium uptake protein